MGGIEALVQAMGEHGASAAVQQHACAALRNLALNDAIRVKMAALGGIEALVQAIGAHGASASVQEEACGALNNLVASSDAITVQSSDAIRVKMAALGGIEALVQAMGEHGASAAVQQHACAALCNLAVDDANKVRRGKIAALGGIEAVLQAMDTHLGHALVQENACWALLNIGWSTGDHQERIKNGGGEEKARRAMAAANATATTKEKGQQLLNKLAN